MEEISAKGILAHTEVSLHWVFEKISTAACIRICMLEICLICFFLKSIKEQIMNTALRNHKDILKMLYINFYKSVMIRKGLFNLLNTSIINIKSHLKRELFLRCIKDIHKLKLFHSIWTLFDNLLLYMHWTILTFCLPYSRVINSKLYLVKSLFS